MPPIQPAKAPHRAVEGHTYLGEATLDELHAGSGIFDEQSGRELTTLEAVRLIEAHRGAQNVYLDWREASQQAKTQNSRHTRKETVGTTSQPGKYIVAVMSQRPTHGD